MENLHESFVERAKVYSQLIARPRPEPKKVKKIGFIDKAEIANQTFFWFKAKTHRFN
jgi:ribosomal protein S10